MMHGCAYGALFGGGGWWIEILLTILVLVCIVHLAFQMFGRGHGNFDRRDSLNILKRRLAAGEITLEEFEKLKDVL